MSFSSLECQVCKKNFSSENSDAGVVVCPVCGAPYHRACYEGVEKCVFEKVHGTERDYCHLKEAQKRAASPFFCGDDAEMSASSPSVPESENLEENVVKEEKDCKYKNKKIGEGFICREDSGSRFDSESFFGDVSVLDLAKFVLFNSGYYLENFEKIKNRRRARFNFCAFWFPAAWFLYRKQYKLGAFLLVLSSMVSVFALFLKVRVLPSILKGIFGSETLKNSDFFNYFSFSESFNKLPFFQKILVFLPSISQFLTLAVMFLSGFFANRIYFKFCIDRIKCIKSKHLTGLEYDIALMKEGGVNHRVLILTIICYLIVNYFPGFFIQ